MPPPAAFGLPPANAGIFLAAVFAGVLLAPSHAAAWGFAAHRLTERRAVEALPPGPLKQLLSNNALWVAEHSVDPDLWRTAGRPNEGPAHFLDLDAFGEPPFPNVPLSEEEHVRRNGADALTKGRVPWRVKEVYDELVAALRERDSEAALPAASALGHYLGDAHVPLHAAINYDGQLTGQDGVHARWEDDLVDRYRTVVERGLGPVRLFDPGDPVAFTMRALRDSFQAVGPLLAADRACAPSRPVAAAAAASAEKRALDYPDGYYHCFFKKQRAVLVSQLGDTSSAIASFWQAAWVAAGSPTLDARTRFEYVRGQAKAILATLDGAAGPLVDDAIARGVMPHLAALRARGARTSQVRVPLPAKTAVSHASLYTGAWPATHGITGNEFVPAGGALGATISGFESTGLRAEPVWVTTARQGLKTTVVQATQTVPFEPYFAERRFGGNFNWNLTILDSFQGFEASDDVIFGRDASCGAPGAWAALPPHAGELRECRFRVAGATVYGLLFDDPKRPTRGYDSLALSPDRGPSPAIVHPDPPSETASAFGRVVVETRAGRLAVFFRLFELRPDGSDFLLYRARAHTVRSSRPGNDAEVLAAIGGAVGNGAHLVYQKGIFGKLLGEGGDGSAERRYIETVALAVQQSIRALDYGATVAPWSLLIGYLPFPDEAFHLWMGRLDPSLPGHDRALAARLRPYLDRVLGLADRYVEALVRHADVRTIVVVGTDHGFVGIDRIFKPNVALAAAGLLATSAEGKVDFSKTQALYMGDSGYVLINKASRPQGIVHPDEEATVLQKAAAALRSARDAQGEPVVTRVMIPGRDGEPGIGGPAGGDLYFDVKPGVGASRGLTGTPVQTFKAPDGDHLFSPDRPEMKGILAIAGPGVAPGDLGGVRQIDVVPTLCHLLGLEPPAHAEGQVVEKALSRKPAR